MLNIRKVQYIARLSVVSEEASAVINHWGSVKYTGEV